MWLVFRTHELDLQQSWAMCSPACFLDDGDGDSDLLPEEDEDEDQDQQQQCTNNTYTAAARTYNMITLPSSKS